ncbi:MAG: heme NO-binding domain-containing protein [Planctomycetes bacterium]|nr:heme NO-binding domain-containing protein [Planctomycetota bacterium]
MKGVVFAQFLDMVEARWGLEVVDRILLAAAPASGGAYTAIGTYDWRELVALVGELSREVDTPVPDLLHAYGRHLFSVFVQAYPQFFAGASTAPEFLGRVESFIHPEVHKLYPDAELPHFVTCATEDGLTMQYRSERPFAEFARGLIEGCMAHFGAEAEVQMQPHCNGAVFHIRPRRATACQVR